MFRFPYLGYIIARYFGLVKGFFIRILHKLLCEFLCNLYTGRENDFKGLFSAFWAGGYLVSGFGFALKFGPFPGLSGAVGGVSIKQPSNLWSNQRNQERNQIWLAQCQERSKPVTKPQPQ